MNHLSKSTIRRIALLLVMALAFGPMGCGMEAAAPEVMGLVVGVAVAATVVAVTVQEFQKIESAQLDIELKRLRIEGVRNGMPVIEERQLSDREFHQIQDSGRVEVNGRVLVFRPE